MNAIQPPLIDFEPITQPNVSREATIQERFEAFHRTNPQVYAALRGLALQMLGNGVRQYGIKGLFEILRWQYALQTKGEPFKLCNDYTSRYARLLVKLNPELDGFFELRGLRNE